MFTANLKGFDLKPDGKPAGMISTRFKVGVARSKSSEMLLLRFDEEDERDCRTTQIMLPVSAAQHLSEVINAVLADLRGEGHARQ
ncbi:hypothetical protein [Roseivivax isoporae]|uniref:Uncharacterized protein n=1 Tax=Roseivivax isoporae LMG 25204 TaxID=1449351 RepID=X7F194_9RHOB|nr:hypothetical protein [Roseivivax isoporae]ETX26687.1 hypothetical protein RISW2_20645 [Roseivivax isoporae LMG 25204]